MEVFRQIAIFLLLLHQIVQRNMRQVLYLFTLAFAVLVSSCDGRKPRKDADYLSVDTVPMMVMQIQKCSRLYTTEYKVHKIVTHDDVLKVKGSLFKQDINVRLPLGQRKVAIPMDATLKAYIDFGEMTEKNIERRGDKITIVLPDPKVEMTSSKINQQQIREFVGLVRSGFTDEELTHYEQQGREAIIRSIPRLGIIDMAKENAARTLIPLIEQMGFKEQDVTIAFRKSYGENDIRRFIEMGGAR